MPDAVILPGRRYGTSAPLLMFTGDLAEQRGAIRHPHEWRTDPGDVDDPSVVDWVRGEITGLLDSLGGRPLLIGKSLGSNAAVLAAERDLPAVWLTPVLSKPWVVAALERASAPFLLVGGTTDRYWDSAAAHRLTPHVLEVPAADHDMYVPGPVAETIAVHSRVIVGVQEFLDDIGWPAP